MAKITKSELIKLQKKYGTDAAIGAQFGITRQAVHQLRKKYGIESSIADNPKRNAEIIKAYKSGMSGIDLSKKYGLSISQTYRIIKEAMGSKKEKEKTTVKKASKQAPKKAPKQAPKKAPKKKPAKKAKK